MLNFNNNYLFFLFTQLIISFIPLKVYSIESSDQIIALDTNEIESKINSYNLELAPIYSNLNGIAGNLSIGLGEHFAFGSILGYVSQEPLFELNDSSIIFFGLQGQYFFNHRRFTDALILF